MPIHHHPHATHPCSKEIEGHAIGSDVSLIFNFLDAPGQGPDLHRHPYAETFILREGEVSFVIGSESVEARAGQVLVAPPGVPHSFRSKSARVDMIDIHASPHFVTEWL
ncbi:cupin domain-containing protein [Roseovarius sp.]|uniref:cupin domain-containing protein n=1 Tax=Roseovarius sp. TaxID=1486281 RepID=UPI003BAB6FB4